MNQSGKSALVIVVVLLVVAIIVSIVLNVMGSDSETTESTTTSEAITTPESTEEASTAGNDAVASGSEETTAAPEADANQTVATLNRYVDWSQTAFDAASEQHRWLFFYADWCPKCRSLDTDITTQRSSIPDDVVIFKVDYDNADALKRQYGVTLQTTVVAVDHNGEATNRYIGTTTTETLANLITQLTE